MRPFSRVRADGTLRQTQAQAAARLAAMKKAAAKTARSKRANGKLFKIDMRSQRGRRLTELIAAYSFGLDLEDEMTAGLVKSTASIALEAEGLEEKSERGETIDNFAFARLINTRERNLQKLRVMRQAQVKAQAPAQGAPSEASATLARYLMAMAAREKAKKAERAKRAASGAAPGGGAPGEGGKPRE
jgi:hypothetical protein